MDMRPALPVAVDIDTDRILIHTRTLERQVSYEQVYTPYDVGRIREGYCCINCGEAQTEVLPERCWICAFPMRERQAERFADEFKGATTVGPSRSLAELRAQDDEMKEKARRLREGRSTSRILVPRFRG